MCSEIASNVVCWFFYSVFYKMLTKSILQPPPETLSVVSLRILRGLPSRSPSLNSVKRLQQHAGAPTAQVSASF